MTTVSDKFLIILIVTIIIITLTNSTILAAPQKDDDEVIVECIRDEEDLQSYHWLTTTAYGYDASGDYVDLLFEGKLEKSSGIFYNVDKTFYLYKMASDIIDLRPTYLYLRYYAHPAFLGSETAYFIPTTPDYQEDLVFTKDFTWKEAMALISMDQVTTGSRIEIQAQLKFGVDPDYLLIDTIILVQGTLLTNMSEVRDLCPPKETNTTTMTPEIETTTSFFEVTSMTMTTEEPEPSDSILECVDDQGDFDFFDWDSYPHHKYAEDGHDLPFANEEGGSLEGTGIFYFEGSIGSKLHLFFKDYTSSFQNFPKQPVYTYLKYYVHKTNVSTKIMATPKEEEDVMEVYIQPVENCVGDYVKPLSTSQTNFVWEEKLIQLDTANNVVGALIELGLHNLEAGDFFLLDKIIVASAPDLYNLLRLIESCL